MFKTMIISGLLAGCILAIPAADFTAELNELQAGKRTEARAEWWGFDAEDSTAALENALKSGAKQLVISRQNGAWLVSRPLILPSNLEIIFENGVEIQAKPGSFLGINDALLTARNCENLTLRGNGTLRMNKGDYQDSKRYKPSEWRHCLAVYNCSNIKIDGLTFSSSGGDGIYLNKVSGAIIENVLCDNNHRQGISVVSAEKLIIRNSRFLNTSGTLPMAGIDFEPNHWAEKLSDCLVENCEFSGNSSSGVEIMLHALNQRSQPVKITLRNCKITGNKRGVMIINHRFPAVTGELNFERCILSGSKEDSFLSIGQTASGYAVNLSDCVIDNRAVKNPGIITLTGGYVTGPLGNLHLKNVSADDSRDNPRMLKFDDWKLYPLQNMTGQITMKDGKVFDLKEAVAESERANPVKSAKIKLEQLIPETGFKPADTVNPVRVRFSGHFVQYAEKGQTVALNVTGEQLGQYAAPSDISLLAPSGQAVGSWKVQPAANAAISFTAGETGIYRFFYTSAGQRLEFKSDHPGCGYLADSALLLNRKAGRMYFLVPAGVKEVALRISGDNDSEPVDAALLDPSGNIAAQQKKLTKPTLFMHQRNNPAVAEVWSVQVSNAVDDFNVAILGDSIPVLSDSPEKLLKYRN